MKVKVVRCDVKIREREKDGLETSYCDAVVIFPDGETAARLFINEDVCDLDTIVPGGVYDLYRDSKGFVLVFDVVRLPDSK